MSFSATTDRRRQGERARRGENRELGERRNNVGMAEAWGWDEQSRHAVSRKPFDFPFLFGPGGVLTQYKQAARPSVKLE
jgi:hypothetical protein